MGESKLSVTRVCDCMLLANVVGFKEISLAQRTSNRSFQTDVKDDIQFSHIRTHEYIIRKLILFFLKKYSTRNIQKYIDSEKYSDRILFVINK